ncbi:MAG: glycosyltransferase family 2 protein [Bacteroidales bacterium]|nr:glycosyltransferase family 2 protein [Bacteroidales bacterium]
MPYGTKIVIEFFVSKMFMIILINNIIFVYYENHLLFMTISLLIPVHNYDIMAFVSALRDCSDAILEFREIIIGDDGSTEEIANKYKALEDDFVKVIRYSHNIGRAAIRNKLIEASTSDYLIFVDQDVMLPESADIYMRKWVSSIGKAKVIFGGILYNDDPPSDPDKMLRWKYGRKFEQKSASERNKHPERTFSTFNVMFDRSVFDILRFNEEIKQYGYEDTLFSYQLMLAGISIYHIDNGLYHDGIETSQEFLDKTVVSLRNLSYIYNTITNEKAFEGIIDIITKYKRLKSVGLHILVRRLFLHYKEALELRLNKPNPPLWIYGFYKIGLFCHFRCLNQ